MEKLRDAIRTRRRTRLPGLKLKKLGNVDRFELRHTRDAQNAALHDTAHSGKRGAHDGRVAVERFEGGRDLEAHVTAQSGIDLLKNESGGIDGKLRGHEG